MADNVTINENDTVFNVTVNESESLVTVEVDTAGHSHGNKSILDTYTYTQDQLIGRVSGAAWVIEEIPTGLVNGSNATFTSEFDFIPSSLVVTVNGLNNHVLEDYTTVGSDTIQFTTSPETGDNIRISYIKA